MGSADREGFMSASIPVLGTITGVSQRNAARLSVVALRANVVLAMAPLDSDGCYCLTLPRAADHPDSPWPLELAVLPSNCVARPEHVPGMPRAIIDREALREAAAVEAPELVLEDSVVESWGGLWRTPQSAMAWYRTPAHVSAARLATLGNVLAWAR